MSKCLSRESISQKEDLEMHKVEVPEWDGHVYVRPLTAKQFGAYEKAVNDGNVSGLLPKIVIWSTCDEDGVRMFTMRDIEMLSGKSLAAIQRISTKVMEINQISEDDIEEMAKN